MKSIESVLLHKVVPPREPVTGGKHPALIFLHGRGANEDDLIPLADYFDPRFLVVSARAPYPFPYGGFAWYEILGEARPEPSMHEESARRILKLVDDCIAGYSVDSSMIYLYGFSMGTMMSFTVSLAEPGRFAGVVANSGYIPEQTNLPVRFGELTGAHFFVGHGMYDPVVAISHARRAKELLQDTGAELEYHEYPMGHEISRESLADASKWLGLRLNERIQG